MAVFVCRQSPRIDLAKVIRRLRSHFGSRRLLLEGGRKINGTFLAANLIDELSILDSGLSASLHDDFAPQHSVNDAFIAKSPRASHSGHSRLSRDEVL